jgi:toxin ParE1/3/4
MPGYKLSQEAEEDIQNILRYGIPNFGVAQALKYHSELETRFELLAQFSRIGTPVYDLRPGLYRYPHKAHTFSIPSARTIFLSVAYLWPPPISSGTFDRQAAGPWLTEKQGIQIGRPLYPNRAQ